MLETELTDGTTVVTVNHAREQVDIPGGGEFESWRVRVNFHGSMDADLARRTARAIEEHAAECVKLNNPRA